MGYSKRRFSWLFGAPKAIRGRSFALVLDFGCGSIPRNPFNSHKVIGCDLSREPSFTISSHLDYRQITPGQNIPFADSSLDGITGFDVIEHLPRQSSGAEGNVFIETMNEFYRVLRPGGILLAVTPCYPSAAAFTDPTHVNTITPGTHKYFSDDNFAKGLSYGFTGEFKTLSAGWYPWTGSWLLNSTVSFLGPNDFAGESERNKPIGKIKRFLSRGQQLLFFVLFPKFRTHYIWVLEKI
jgi:SAM-dependent methyltransferase